MMRNVYLVVLSLILSIGYGFSQAGMGELKGSVIDGETKEPIPFAKVIISQGGIIKGGTETDFDGKFHFPSLQAGSYDVEIRSTEYQPLKLSNVGISAERIQFLDKTELNKPDDVKQLEEVEVRAFKVPLINKDGGSAGQTITREDIAKLPVRDAAGIASTVGGVAESEGTGGISVRGSREDASFYFIDGIKVRGSSNLPKSALEEVQVITGGLPANYGDATGGIISVTTRGPSKEYFGSIEAVSSGFYLPGDDPLGYDGRVIGLDAQAYNLFEGMLSGPIWMKQDEDGNDVPLLGFLASVTYSDIYDPRPVADGSWRVRKEVREELLENPLRPTSTGEGNFNNVSFLRIEDFEKTPWRMNSRRRGLTGSVKMDVNTGPNANLTFGGSMNYNGGKVYSYNQSLLNFDNFGVSHALDWRVYGRWTQRFRFDREGSSSKWKSFYYNLMVDYSKSDRRSHDENHEFNVFNYGHVGYFDISQRRTYDFNQAGDSLIQNTVPRDVLVEFTPSNYNPALAAITAQYFRDNAGSPIGRFENLTQVQQGNALRNGDLPGGPYGIWGALGAPFNQFSKSEAEQLRATGSASMVFGGHNISLGFELERRVDRGWGSGRIGPARIWEFARQYANNHINELDLANPIFDYFGTYPRISYERLNTGHAAISGTGQYGGALVGDNQSFFDYNFRNEVGLDPAGNDFLNIDAYDPSLFRLDMFSPDELFAQGQNFISYFGYDHTGQRVRGNTDINRYFTAFNDDGNYERFIGAFQPNYFAAYIMDKFSFDDIVFNVGLRLDVLDLNQPVLRDQHLFFNSRTAGEARALKAEDPDLYAWVNIPQTIGDDYIVYVNDYDNASQINGFRNGENWFDSNGTSTQDPSSLRGSAGIAPWLLNPGQETPDASAFERYKPAINLMPRVAFSFPISDEANFFANYDILTKRPTVGNRFDPIDYQFVRERSVIFPNANLRPERTIDYAFGFQQVLTRTSSLKLNAFYREFRDQVQVRNIFEAYPATYITYGNRDFGTVKGLTLEYDLRRTGNLRINANYTLQFAEGTGSDANSALTFVNANQPDLRFVFPFSYDQRHQFAFTVDYRYGQGKDYNGPRIGDINILENTGLNIITLVNSGTPYSRQANITPVAIGVGTPQLLGQVNGSRLPWTYRLDMQLDRTFDVTFGGEDGNKRRGFLQVYCRVTNLFNQFNVLNVYRATGNPNDDGYLAAAQSQATIQNQLDEQSFRDMYAMSINNPFNISVPRTIRLGVMFTF
jgi:outer membrane receptor protein involved in Fe transport